MFQNKIPYVERRAVYEDALRVYGADAQLVVAVEEMSELTKELCKHARGSKNRDCIAEEIADVTIMLEQLRLIFGVHKSVCDQMDAKVERLRKRLAEKEDSCAE